MSIGLMTETSAIVLDAGTGLGRLFEKSIKDMFEPYDRISIILTHYHLDHIIGLSFLPGIFKNKKVTLYCPSHPFVSANPKEAISKLISPPLFAETWNELSLGIDILPIDNHTIYIEDVKITLHSQCHPGGSMGIRLGDEVAYLTDTPIDRDALQFVAGVKLLMHEVWLSSSDVDSGHHEQSKHADTKGVATLIKNAGNQFLMPVHHHPERSNEELLDLWHEISLEGVSVVAPTEGSLIYFNEIEAICITQ